MNPDAVLDLKTALVAAARDPAARARAVSALRGVELWAATWAHDPTRLRTLTNSSGLTALPLFTDERELQDAALRYGWLTVDGQAPRRLLPLFEGLRAAVQQQAKLLVLDIASEHAFELDEGEMDLLSATPSARPPSLSPPKVRSTPPPAGVAQVKRASGRPDDGDDAPYSVLRPRSVTPLYGTVSATFGAPPTATMLAFAEEPQDELVDALNGVLRNYPEVEWASLVLSSRADHGPQQAVALRISPEFRINVGEITQKLREAASEHGESYDVLLLETAEQMKEARQIGLPFYPWRKR